MKEYNASSIGVLKGLEAVQKRPGMYVGDISSVSATHHLLYEVFDNSIDEALAGHANRIDVILHADGSATVADNGRGIPVDLHPEEGISAAEVIFTVLHAGGKFDGDSYQYSGGLHGVGAACTNGLSDWLETEITRDNAVWAARFENGATVTPIHKVRGMKKGEDTGTRVTFRPSARYLAVTEFERDTLLKRFREVAFLNAGVEIRFRDERGDPYEEVCHFTDGMADFVAAMTDGANLIFPIVKISGSHAGTEVDTSFSWVEEDQPEDVRAYTNNIPQPDGGQHVTGLRGAITKALLAWAEQAKMIKRSGRMGPDDLREGLAAALHVRLRDPAFSSQTKEKLISTEARAAVEAVVTPIFTQWLDTHPEEARLIIQRAQNAAEAREAAKKARELTRTKKVGRQTSSVSLPEKLSDCSSKNPADRELFLVEGDSAGGSAKQGRDREIQAILPLRGKILNVERARMSKVLANAEVSAMIQTLGAGVGGKLDLAGLRYGKIVIMTDADVDGSHIATLITTFFFRHMTSLIMEGHLYLAVPPLYRVRRKGEEDIYVRTERDLTGLFFDRAIANKALSLDGEILEGAAARRMLDGLIENAQIIPAAARILRHSKLADVLLGEPAARPLFGTGPIAERKLKSIVATLTKGLDAADPDATWRLEVTGDGTGYGLKAIRHEDGLDTDYSLSRSDLTNWQVLRIADEYKVAGIAGSPVEVAKTRVFGPISFVDALREAGAKGAAISRYKGLGEMNPEELWETTMNPRTRTLHRVRIEDAERADRMISDLMAENVSARRGLIEDMFAGTVLPAA